ncbi:aminotransferase class I/II-fold pyridoxal phosphate-dependent enzyme [Streptomyces mirabilis]|uniref:aminotransferase class I/II-fold pyridoxal phosphate-dependent enzyme n=1 Tax=Streptomyces mirabilis TaxID=68239 RepID=UPI00332C2FF9
MTVHASDRIHHSTEQHKRQAFARLHLNEHPLPPLPSVAHAISEALACAQQYPDFHPDALATTLARWCDLPDDQVVVGNGSVGVALQFLHAALSPGSQLAYGWPNFDAYPLLAEMTHAEPVSVPLRFGGHQDLTAFLKAIGPQTRAVVVCNPHNPTGTLVDAPALAEFLARVPPHVLVLLDEAYIEFAGPERPDSLMLLPQHPNMVILRTFSKAYGLAGLRIGYGLAHRDLAQAARRHQLPFGITAAATAAVHASLQVHSELLARIRTITHTRDSLREALIQQGWTIPHSHANFLWLEDPGTIENTHRRLRRASFHARAYPGEGLRLTVPDTDTVPSLLDALSSHTSACSTLGLD